ncbi:MAG: hypothetical protein ACYC2K_03165 [Gemmatimonadales bacterium]
MSKNDLETKSLVLIILVGYSLNLVLGWVGSLYAHGSGEQMLLFQIGTACAISASVMAARYVGMRGQHVAASAYILLGIAHGISLAALGKDGIDPVREATMAMPMIPALIFMFWCELFPKWLKAFAIVPSVLFALIYVGVHLSGSFELLTLYAGYATLQLNEVAWGIYILRDWRRTTVQGQGQ